MNTIIRAVPVALLLLLAPAVLCSSSASDLHGTAAPLMFWGNAATSLQNAQKGSHLEYQVIPDVADAAAKVILSAVGKLGSEKAGELNSVLSASQQLQQGAVVAFIGSQLDTTDVRKSQQLAKLDSLLQSSPSSVVLPYTSFQGQCLHGSLKRLLEDAGVAYRSINCKDASEDLAADVGKALEGSADKVEVLLVCSKVADELDQTEKGLQVELEQLMQVQEALEASGLSHLVVYASRSKPSIEGQRRSLQTTSGDFKGFGAYDSCGTLCQVQVRWMEGLLAILFLAVAACSGLTCLYLLDGPTKFETVKDQQQ